MYQRRLKSNNSKSSKLNVDTLQLLTFYSVHCAYEGAKMSKESTDLGIVTDTGSMR